MIFKVYVSFSYFRFCFSEGKGQGKECESTRTLRFFIPYTNMGATLMLYQSYVLYCDLTQMNYSLNLYITEQSNDTFDVWFSYNQLTSSLFCCPSRRPK